MSQTITVRLTRELADWLQRVANSTGVSQGRIIRDQLEKAKASASSQAFMRLAGSVRGPKDLSSRGLFPAMKGIADTGFLVAFANRNDRHHAWIIRMSELHPRHSVVTVNRADFRVYRRNKRETIPLICPPEA